ncbi:MAG TPA: SigmaK-factor processing regulatory BofA [Syntrophomonas sp.]|nr:SigmaK-factor processing regulatory BofA [Syntrophomonas sp.]
MPGINVAIAAIVVVVILYFVLKMFLKPIQLLWKLALNSVVGLVLLMIFNYLASYFAFFIPINIITILIAGFLGVPGVLLLVAFQYLLK